MVGLVSRSFCVRECVRWTSDLEVVKDSWTYDFVYTENGSDVYTGVDVAATVQRIEDDAVLPPVAVLNEDSLLILFRNEDCSFPGCPKTVDHDIVG